MHADAQVAPIPGDIQDRRVEITGPVDRKMVINALNSGANVYMADFEDSNAPTWCPPLPSAASTAHACWACVPVAHARHAATCNHTSVLQNLNCPVCRLLQTSCKAAEGYMDA